MMFENGKHAPIEEQGSLLFSQIEQLVTRRSSFAIVVVGLIYYCQARLLNLIRASFEKDSLVLRICSMSQLLCL